MFRNRMFLAVVSGHFAVDVLNSTGAVLLAVLAGPLGLSYHQVGTALTLYLLIGSLSQPLFGWLADKLPDRSMLLTTVSVLWMAVFYTLVALAPSWNLLLPALLLAALGSGLFHPVGASSAGSAMPERAGSSTAIFFFGGQAGLAIGPMLAGFLAGHFGGAGVLPLTLMALLPASLLALATRDERRLPKTAATAAAARPQIRWSRTAIALVVAFVVLVAVRSSIQSTYQAFLPSLFRDRSWDPTMFGLLAGVFIGAGAVGQVLMGGISDRLGIRAATVWPLLLSVPAGLLCFLAGETWQIFLACATAGILIGGQHSVLVVHAQRLLPVKQGFAAGLILGFTFASGALGTWLAGMLADSVGLQTVMLWLTLLGLPAALLGLALPGRQQSAPVAAPAQAAPAPSGD
jgi:FSR family fosmidomycin resistance protein-like MFS transporter